MAQWITGDYKVNKKQRYPVDCFRKTFESGQVKTARLYATACGLYEGQLNGEHIGDFVLAPGNTDYRKRITRSFQIRKNNYASVENVEPYGGGKVNGKVQIVR